MEILIQTIRIYNQGIGMEFRLERCTTMRSGKRQIAEETEFPDQERIRILGEKENYMYREILEVDFIKQEEVKEK